MTDNTRVRLNHDMPDQVPQSLPTLVSPDGAVILRPYQPHDVGRIVEMIGDPEFARWTNTPVPFTDSDGRAFLVATAARVSSGELLAWAIEAEIEGVRRLCSCLRIRLIGDGRGDISYGLHPEGRGRGLVRAAGRLALDWVFDAVGLEVVTWNCVVGNWASRWTALGLGFRVGGVARKAYARRGELVDVWIGEVTRDDSRESAAPPRQPVLTGPGVRLRPFAERDAPRIAEACNDEATQHWVSILPRPYRLSDAEGFIEWCREGKATGQEWTWCVAGTDSDECLGAITLFGLAARDGAGEIGYWAHPDARRRGLTSVAARLVADFALGPGPAQTVRLFVAEDNHASQRVAERTGATRVGTLPAYSVVRDGTRTDMILFLRGRQPAADR
ncbi:GNAT family N-acetyltransferase [Ammonicoccus fulvus]|uniref:GNAT family N-acetyltransferase n=1 Tax=Ammonicoccus fulvus TaxID=3138240 RepID=A0ABZ3FVM5_9ACTN